LKDIAKDLGLSPMAVSKALRGHKDIGEETREHVLRRARELNYRTDLVARSLVTGQSFLVGLIVPDLMQSFFAEIATAVANTLSPAGYHVVISNSGESAQTEAADIELLVSRKVDGLIVASAQDNSRFFSGLKTPYVLIDRTVPGLKANYVGTQNEETGFLATDHLIEQGCRRVAHLKGPPISTGKEREAGYLRALRKRGHKIHRNLIVEAGHDDVAGYVAMQRLLKSDAPPDGVFCYNDPVAIGALRAILDAGLSIPRDVAVVGVANMHFSDTLVVPLSTVDQCTEEMGREAAKRLLACMPENSPMTPNELRIAPKLIVRTSSRKRASSG
jgi:LacI family transcriptional regulator